ncbi:hypothetical protein B6U74_05730 [Candidatus Bathyarchaeota archaeon ex4484_205]|nr:MAG: hypothetical protein B6U74_05730 [Candidatus Bathyarchaeota archaeon ex4484_205]
MKQKLATIFILLSLILILAIPHPVTSSPITVTTNKSTYYRGETVIISGKATPNTAITIKIYPSQGSPIPKQAQSDSTGAYSTTYKLSSSAPYGIWTIEAKDTDTGETATTTFRVKEKESGGGSSGEGSSGGAGAKPSVSINLQVSNIAEVNTSIEIKGSVYPSVSYIYLVIRPPSGEESKVKLYVHDGMFTYNLFLSEVGAWRVHAEYPGDSNYSPSTTGIRTIMVKVRVSIILKVSPKVFRIGEGSVNISGKVKPVVEGSILLYASPDNVTWMLISRLNIIDGFFNFLWSPPFIGTVCIKAVIEESDLCFQSVAYSSFDAVVVRKIGLGSISVEPIIATSGSEVEISGNMEEETDILVSIETEDGTSVFSHTFESKSFQLIWVAHTPGIYIVKVYVASSEKPLYTARIYILGQVSLQLSTEGGSLIEKWHLEAPSLSIFKDAEKGTMEVLFPPGNHTLHISINNETVWKGYLLISPFSTIAVGDTTSFGEPPLNPSPTPLSIKVKTYTLNVIILDSNGNPQRGKTVRISGVETKISHTDDAGLAKFEDLLPGVYTINVDSQTLSTELSEDMTLIVRIPTLSMELIAIVEAFAIITLLLYLILSRRGKSLFKRFEVKDKKKSSKTSSSK